MAQNLEQWVNLTKHEIFTKDGDGATLDRCGKITVEAMFEKANIPIGYKVKVTPVGGNNATYTKKEMHRNPNFRMTKGRVGASDDKHVLLEDSIQLPAAGGNEYIVEAKDSKGNVVKSPISVIAKRKLYYQVITMDAGKGNAETTVNSYSLSAMRDDYKKYHIAIVEKGSPAKISFYKTITESNQVAFAQEVARVAKFDANKLSDQDLKRVGFSAVFSNYIADMGNYTFAQTVQIGTATPYCDIHQDYIVLAGDQLLWYGLDDADDQVKKYLRSGLKVKYTDQSGNVQSILVPESEISIANVPSYFQYGGYIQLQINITPALRALLNNKSGTLDFEIDVNIVSSWTNGFQWRAYGADLVTVARRIEFKDMNATTIPYTWNHEVGHRLGMVAYGNKGGEAKYKNNIKFREKKWLPDAPTTLYGENPGVNDQGHQGPHCSNGANFDGNGTWTDQPLCVMFGANGTSEHMHAPKDYCDKCQPIVRKLDLSLSR